MPRPSEPASPPAALLAAAILIGLAASWGWLVVSPGIAAALASESLSAAVALHYAIVFLPLALLGIVLAALSGVPVLPGGKAPARRTLAGLAIGGGGLCAALGLSWLAGALVPGPQATGASAMLLLGIALVLLQTGTEEVLLRGWLQPVLSRAISPMAGIALAALVFAALHRTAGAVEPLALINIALAGTVFGMLRHRTGGLTAPVAAHFGWNAAENLLFGAFPNPGIGPFGALLDADLIGPAHWGGGDTGLNASISTGIVLAALTVALATRWFARPTFAPAAQ